MTKPICLAMCLLGLSFASGARAELRVGTAKVDVTPLQFPVLVNGGMLSRSVQEVNTPLSARALVLDDGRERVAVVVVDSCMMPRRFLDEAKQLAAKHTEIRPERMLISATHTHTAPSSMACLGTRVDAAYVPFLRERLAEAMATAESRLEPARVGWAVANAAQYTALRRWIRRPDRIEEDPFGNPTVRANMHAGRNWDDVTGESGPEDPDLSLIAFQSPDGRPLAVLANFSMHYFGDRALSADYFGLFCQHIEEQLAGDLRENQLRPLAIMSHGCSGDIWRRDYKQPVPPKDQDYTIDRYAKELADLALGALESVSYRQDADLAMAERRLPLNYRTPDAQRLQWARRIVEAMGDRPPKTRTEVYAREQMILHQWQSTEIVLQALRIGDIAIATTPNETYALTGLKLKLQSPLTNTMVIELANGGDGYIPPPEQHLLGGYNTWPARSAGLEVTAEPKIVAASLELLEQVAGRPCRNYRQSDGPAARAILKNRPLAYWRMGEFSGPLAVDASGHHRDGHYEPAVAYFLPGPRSEAFCQRAETNRAVHFAGDRLRARFPDLGDRYSVSLWFWNGMPTDARDTTGWMVSRGRDYGLGPHSEHLGLGGTATEPGKLVLQHGDGQGDNAVAVGRTTMERWSWHQVVLVRDGNKVAVYLDGNAKPEIEVKSDAEFPAGFDQFFFGGRCDRAGNWEGRLDEIAVFDRALSTQEVGQLRAR